jgi:hypothetical protein
MKTMKTQKTPALLALALLTLLALGGCMNALDPISPAEGQSRPGGLLLNINGGSAARTAFPRSDFAQYVISFSSGVGTHDPITVTNPSSIRVDGLANGSWTITVKAYMAIDANNSGSVDQSIYSGTNTAGELFEAASGTWTGNITGAAQNLNISLNPAQGAAQGYLKYTVSFPESGIDSAVLKIKKIGGFTLPDIDLTSISPGSGTAENVVELDSGYYLVSSSVSNAYHRAGRTEIAHIYSGMETPLSWTFDGDDFIDYITVTGTLDLSFTGGPILSGGQEVIVELHRAEINAGNVITSVPLGQAAVDGTTGEFIIPIAPYAGPTTVYYLIQYKSSSSAEWTPHIPVTPSLEVGSISVTIPPEQNPSVTPPAATLGDVTVTGTVDSSITPVNFTITLSGGATFKAISANTVVNSWITNHPSGLVAAITSNINAGDTTGSITISGSPRSASAGTLALTIPAANLQGTLGSSLTAAVNSNAKFQITDIPDASLSGLVYGVKNQSLWASLSLRLKGGIHIEDKVEDPTNGIEISYDSGTATPINSWFTNLPAGLDVFVDWSYYNDYYESQDYSISVRGTPTETKDAPIVLQIPAASLAGYDGPDPLVVTANPLSKFFITNNSNTLSGTIDLRLNGAQFEQTYTDQSANSGISYGELGFYLDSGEQYQVGHAEIRTDKTNWAVGTNSDGTSNGDVLPDLPGGTVIYAFVRLIDATGDSNTSYPVGSLTLIGGGPWTWAMGTKSFITLGGGVNIKLNDSPIISDGNNISIEIWDNTADKHLGSYRIPANIDDWEFILPAVTVPREIRIRIDLDTPSAGRIQNIEDLCQVTNIAVTKNFDDSLVSVSGTLPLSNVTLDSNQVDFVEVDICKPDGTAVGLTEVKGGDSWKAVLRNYTGPVKFKLVVLASGSDIATASAFLTNPTPTVPATGLSNVSLGTVNIVTRKVTLNVSGSGGPFIAGILTSPLTSLNQLSNYTMAEKMAAFVDEPFIGQKVIPVDVSYTGNLYFLVADESNDDVYVSGPVDTGSGDYGPVNLNTAGMTKLQ